MLSLGACNDDSAGGGGGAASTTFIGIAVGGTAKDESGSLVFVVDGTALAPPAALTTSSAAPFTVSGSVTLVSPAAGSQSLTGTYDPATDVLDVSGGGYGFTGGYDGASRLEGTYTGPNGPGSFVAALEAVSAQAYCGTFAGDDDGIWNFVVNGTVLSGTALSSSGQVVALDGTVTANDVTIVNPLNLAGPPLATGTLGAPATGLWDNGVGESGSWTGTAC
jgi:hypothetical protein